jgi:hypothetical protein
MSNLGGFKKYSCSCWKAAKNVPWNRGIYVGRGQDLFIIQGMFRITIMFDFQNIPL